MGLLSQGKPLTWPETKENAELVRQLGIDQFIRIYHDIKERKNDCLKWGDEVSSKLLALKALPFKGSPVNRSAD